MYSENLIAQTGAGPDITFPLLSLVDGNQEFQVRMPSLREVIDARNITPVPYMPKFIRGIMPYGNGSIPVIDFQCDGTTEPGKESAGACVLVFSHHDREFGVVMEKACEQARKALDRAGAHHGPHRDKRHVWSCNCWW